MTFENVMTSFVKVSCTQTRSTRLVHFVRVSKYVYIYIYIYIYIITQMKFYSDMYAIYIYIYIYITFYIYINRRHIRVEFPLGDLPLLKGLSSHFKLKVK